MIHVTLKDQPADPRLLLERNVRHYAGLVQKIMPRLSPMEPGELASQTLIMMKDKHAGSEWLNNAHVLAIGLRQRSTSSTSSASAQDSVPLRLRRQRNSSSAPTKLLT